MSTVRVAVLLAIAAATLPARATRAADPGLVLVRFEDGVPRDAVHASAGGTRVNRLAPERVDVVRVASVARALRDYARADGVASVEPNGISTGGAFPDDPFYPGNGAGTVRRLSVGPFDLVSDDPNDLWALHNTGQHGGVPDADIDAPDGWAMLGAPSGGAQPHTGPVLGVVDSGIMSGHDDLNGVAVPGCMRATSGDGTLRGGCADDNGHGTHVSGTIAATANNGTGVTGVAYGARILMCKALASDNAGTWADIAACVNEIVARRGELDVRVLSMSIVGGASETIAAAVRHAASSGILVVACGGNTGDGAITYPGGFEDAVAVSWTTRTGARASLSNANADIELSAPGEAIVSTVPVFEVDARPAAYWSGDTARGRVPASGGYATRSGCSMATPHAAAVAAMGAQRHDLSGDALRRELRTWVDDLGPPGRDPVFGFGRVNLAAALAG